MARLVYGPGRVRIETPFKAEFVEDLKSSIPFSFRSWDEKQRVWTVYIPHVTRAREITLKHFPDTFHIQEEQYEPNENASYYQRPGDPNDQDTDDFFRNFRSNYQRREENARRQNQHTQHAQDGSYEHAAQTLYVTLDAPPEVITAAYKALARKHHPDLGGDPQTMQRINAAFDLVKQMKGMK